MLRNLVVGLVLSGLVLCGCGAARNESVPRPLSSGKSDPSPSTAPDSSSATSEVSLSEVFRDEGVLLMGTAPSVAETLDFVAYYQYIDEACEQAEHASSCSAMADADVIAQGYLETHNQAAIAAHSSAATG